MAKIKSFKADDTAQPNFGGDYDVVEQVVLNFTISYLDSNRFTIENGLVDEDPTKVRKFIREIEAQGFQYAYRGGK